jgi:alanine transaminase
MIKSADAFTAASRLLFRACSASTIMMRPLTVDSLNPALPKVEYAVRGELAIKSERYRVALKQGKELPFKSIISSNIGNPQQIGLDQPPITFVRQVCCSIICFGEETY